MFTKKPIDRLILLFAVVVFAAVIIHAQDETDNGGLDTNAEAIEVKFDGSRDVAAPTERRPNPNDFLPAGSH